MALSYKSSLSRYRRYLQMVQSRPLLATSLWVILSLVLLIVLLVLALRPTLITIADLMSKINQQKAVSQQLEDKMVTVRLASENLDKIGEQLYLLDLGSPKESYWSELSSILVGMATQSGTELDNIVVNRIPLSTNESIGTKQDPVEISMPKGLIPVRFNLTAYGEYEKLEKLVELVEKMRRVSIIDMVQIQLTKNGDYRVTIKAETSYRPENSPL